MVAAGTPPFISLSFSWHQKLAVWDGIPPEEFRIKNDSRPVKLLILVNAKLTSFDPLVILDVSDDCRETSTPSLLSPAAAAGEDSDDDTGEEDGEDGEDGLE